MLKVININSEDYYKNFHEEIEGYSGKFFYGSLSKKLNLDENINDDVVSYIRNLRKHRNMKDRKERLGVDLTFSPPKSVSIVALLLGDKKVIDAHIDAVKRTLSYIEQNIPTTRNTSKNVKNKYEKANLFFVCYNHLYSREFDMQLHTHCLLPATVERKSDGKFTALENSFLLDKQVELGNIYRRYLAENLKALGYNITIIQKSNFDFTFEISNIPTQVINLFSKRHTEIIKETKKKISEILKKRVESKEHLENIERQFKRITAFSSRKRKQKVDFNQIQELWKTEMYTNTGLTIKDLEMIINQKNKQTYIEIEEESKRKLERLRQVLLELEKKEKEIEKKEMSIQQAEIELEKKKQEYYKMRDENKQKLKRLQEILLMIDNRENVLEDATILNNLIESAYEYNFKLNPEDLLEHSKSVLQYLEKLNEGLNEELDLNLIEEEKPKQPKPKFGPKM